MINAGASIVGEFDTGRVLASIVRSYAIGDIVFDPALAASVVHQGGVLYDSAAGVTSLWWSRPLAGADLDLTTKMAAPFYFIYAYGFLGQPWSMHDACGAVSIVLYPEGCSRNTTCSGHGDCTGAGSCGCDVGYAGSACDMCAPLFTPALARTGSVVSLSRVCYLFDSTLDEGRYGVQMLLSLHFVDICADGCDWASASDYAGALLSAIVAAAGSPTAVAFNLTLGPVTSPDVGDDVQNATLTLTLQPTGQGVSAVTSTSHHVESAIASLVAAVADPSSDLAASIAGFTIAGVALLPPLVLPLLYGEVQPSGSSGASMVSTASVTTPDGGACTLAWRMTGGSGSPPGPTWLHGELTCDVRGAWAGIGFNALSSKMTPSDSVACEPPATGYGFGNVRALVLNGYTATTCPLQAQAAPGGEGVSSASDVLDAPSAIAIAGAPVVANGSKTASSTLWCRFRRLAKGAAPVVLDAAAGGGSVTPPTLLSGPVYLSFAHGSPGVTAVGSHTTQRSGAVYVDFVTGVVVPVPSSGSSDVLLAHAVIGSIALLVVLPAGVFAARYYKGVGASTPHSVGTSKAVWYRVHIFLTVLGVLCVIASCGLAVSASAAAAAGGATTARSHFGSAHGALGLAVTLLVIALTAVSTAWPPPVQSATADAAASATHHRGRRHHHRRAAAAPALLVHRACSAALLVLAIPLLLTGAATYASAIQALQYDAGVTVIGAVLVAVAVALLTHESILRCCRFTVPWMYIPAESVTGHKGDVEAMRPETHDAHASPASAQRGANLADATRSEARQVLNPLAARSPGADNSGAGFDSSSQHQAGSTWARIVAAVTPSNRRGGGVMSSQAVTSPAVV